MNKIRGVGIAQFNLVSAGDNTLEVRPLTAYVLPYNLKTKNKAHLKLFQARCKAAPWRILLVLGHKYGKINKLTIHHITVVALINYNTEELNRKVNIFFREYDMFA